MIPMASAMSLVHAIEERVPDVSVSMAEVHLYGVRVGIGQIDSDVDGLLPLADVARELGLREWKRPVWIGNGWCFAYSGEWEGLVAQVYAYSAKTSNAPLCVAPADPLAVGVAA